MAADMALDETICSMAVCQHPQCWATFRRIEHGHPRHRPLGAVTKMPSLDQGGLPVLSVTTIPVSPTPPHHQYTQQLNVSSLMDFNNMASPAVYNVYNSATCSMDKILFPGVNSYRELPETRRRPAPRSSPRKPRQVAMVDSCLQDLHSSSKMMVWVPNSPQKSQKEEMREKPLRVQMTELTFTDVPTRSRRENRDLDEIKKRGLNKPPTGGCPQNLTLGGSTALSQNHVRKRTTARQVHILVLWENAACSSDNTYSSPQRMDELVEPASEQRSESRKDNAEEMTRNRRRASEYCPDLDLQADPDPDGALLENRRVILHNVREKHQHAQANSLSGPVYRLDEQYDALDNMEIDLKSIKNQYYLWKKYISLAGPTHRIKPPDQKGGRGQRSHTLRTSRQGGNIGLFPYDLDSALSFYRQRVSDTPAGSTVCDTERSCDTDIKAGSSQTSLTEAERSNTPSECDSAKNSERGSLEERVEEAEADQVIEDENIPQTLPDGEQEHLPAGKEKSEREPPAPDVCRLEMTNDQRGTSPQPKPPPPSPTHNGHP